MTPQEALGLGVLQGATEFLPVSSSGHLALAEYLMPGLEEPQLLFDVVAHLGTLFAIVFVLRDRVWGLIRAGFGLVGIGRDEAAQAVDRHWLMLIIVASIPTAIIGLTLRDTVTEIRLDPRFVGAALLVTAALLFSTERLGTRTRGADQLGWKDALLIGCVQGFAVVPGISRSGSTVAAALWRNSRAETAVELSILISLPAVLGANILELAKNGFGAVEAQLTSLGIGFGAALVTGLLSLKALQWIVTNRKLSPFALYCACVGLGAMFFG